MSRWIQDAGHGGNDPGAVKYGQYEKEWALEAALYVNERLKELNISSDATRISDVTIPRNTRTSKVKPFDKCISHHFNAGGGTGTELIHSIHADGQFEALLRVEFEKAGYPFRRTFTRTYPAKDDKDFYYMHRETGKCRVTIVEYDFLDGPNRYRLQNDDYRFGLYECVVRAICREEGTQYIPIEEILPGDDHNEPLIYHVISGSFHELNNAERRKSELELVGFDPTISTINVDDYLFHRVVVGAFANQEEAEKKIEQLRQEGFDSFFDVVQEEE
ncbi:N-acetylmuramoyl-L-alanine amidase [Bacillaceae bacterium W0354]